LEEEAFATPEETFESIFKRVYEDANLADVKIKINEAQAELDKETEKYNNSIAKINENPFRSEANRTGAVRREFEMYSATAKRLQGKITTLSNEYERGQDRAENVAIRVLSEIKQGQQRTKEELSYYRQRAQADLEAELETAEAEEEKELMRYYPEFVEHLPAPEKKAPTTKKFGDKWYQWNKSTGEWEDMGVKEPAQDEGKKESKEFTRVKQIVAMHPGEWGHAADQIDREFGVGTATKYDDYLKSVYQKERIAPPSDYVKTAQNYKDGGWAREQIENQYKTQGKVIPDDFKNALDEVYGEEKPWWQIW